jgi:hypothetical protein
MAHFAQLDENNFVIQVTVIANAVMNDLPFPESEPLGVAFCQSLFGEGTIWKQTSYNNNFRGNYAGPGYYYSPENDIFLPQKPYPSWTLNVQKAAWEAPVPMPTAPDGYIMVWDEIAQEWDTYLDRA